MRALRNILATIHLLSGVAVLGAALSLLTGVMSDRVRVLLESPAGRIAAYVAIGILGLGVLVNVIATYARRPDPTCVHPDGNPNVEVSLQALTSAATRAAAADDVLIEGVEGRIIGRDHDRARLLVEAISFSDEGLDGLARGIQERVADACTRLLGTAGIEVRVRFLPSKTTIITREVPDER